MGKGSIESGGTGGLYTIKLLYSTENYNKEMAALEAKLLALNEVYDSYPANPTPAEETRKGITLLSIISVEKRIAALENNFVAEKTIQAWCADYSESITGVIGTVEVPGETTHIQIQPGYENNSSWDVDRDGQLQQTFNLDYAGTFYNLAMLPGWQKWKPTFRYGTITAIDGNTANVTLENINSSQQSLEINQTNTLNNVTIDYMDCDGAAFTIGDEVLVKFTDQNWSNPVIVGSKDNPKPCDRNYLVLRVYDTGYSIDEYMVYNLVSQTLATDLPLNGTGGIVTFPATAADLSYWFGQTSQTGSGIGIKGGTAKKEGLSPIASPLYGSENLSETLPCSGDNYTNTRVGTYDTYPGADGETWGATRTTTYNLNNAICYWSGVYIMTSRIGDTDIFGSMIQSGSNCDVIMNQEIEENYKFFTPATTISMFDNSFFSVEETSWENIDGSWFRTGIECEKYAELIRTPTPYMYGNFIETDELYMLVAYTSFGWQIEATVSGAQCSSFCGSPIGPPYTTTNQPWKQFLIVDSEYDGEGLAASFDPTSPTGSNVGDLVGDYLLSVYNRYRTNGFPITDTNGPAWRLNQVLTTRS